MRITFTGDILVYQSQDEGCLKSDGKRDYLPIFEKVKPLLAESDYVVGSMETTLAGQQAGYTTSSIRFNTPDELVSALKEVGFDMLTTANNHCFDRGEDGLRRTIETIRQYGLEQTGTRLSEEEPTYLVKDFDGTRVAFVAYTYGTNSDDNGFIVPQGKEYLVNLTRKQDLPYHSPLWKRVIRKMLTLFRKPKPTSGIVGDCVADIEVTNGRNVLFEKQMLETIREAKQRADIVIMCLHSGGQFNSQVGAYTNHLFDIIADAGADAIICNHAHKILPVYKKGNCIIAAALGNFSCSPGEGYWVEGVEADYSALLTLDIADKKNIGHKVDICRCVRNGNGLAITEPVYNEQEIETIQNRLACVK